MREIASDLFRVGRSAFRYFRRGNRRMRTIFRVRGEALRVGRFFTQTRGSGIAVFAKNREI